MYLYSNDDETDMEDIENIYFPTHWFDSFSRDTHWSKISKNNVEPLSFVCGKWSNIVQIPIGILKELNIEYITLVRDFLEIANYTANFIPVIHHCNETENGLQCSRYLSASVQTIAIIAHFQMTHHIN